MAAFIFPLAKLGYDLGTEAIADSNSDRSFRNGWTQQQPSPLSSANPGKNIMITCVDHDATQLKGSQHQDLICACPSGDKQHYDAYIFDEGVFLHKGDGGYLNWAFCGLFIRDGDKV